MQDDDISAKDYVSDTAGSNEPSVEHMTQPGSPITSNSQSQSEPISPSKDRESNTLKYVFAALFLVVVIPATAILTILLAGSTGSVKVGVNPSPQGIREDLLLEEALESMSSEINSSVSSKGTLPKSLNDLKYLSYAGQVARKNNLIQYEPLERIRPEPNNPSYKPELMDAATTPSYHYRLCATFAERYKDKLFQDRGAEDGQIYPDYPNVHSHAAGKVCYDLQTYTLFSEDVITQ